MSVIVTCSMIFLVQVYLHSPASFLHEIEDVLFDARNLQINVTQYTHADWLLTSSVTDSVICSYLSTHQCSLVLARWQANRPLKILCIAYFNCSHFLLYRGTNLMLYFFKFSACRLELKGHMF